MPVPVPLAADRMLALALTVAVGRCCHCGLSMFGASGGRVLGETGVGN